MSLLLLFNFDEPDGPSGGGGGPSTSSENAFVERRKRRIKDQNIALQTVALHIAIKELKWEP